MTRDDLEKLYQQATGARTGHGAQSWAADVLRVSERTVRRWCAGETHPTAVQVTRLRMAARIAERARQIGQDRRAGRGPWQAIREYFSDNFITRTVEATQRALERQAAERSRANHAFDRRGPDARDRLPGGRVDNYREHRHWRSRSGYTGDHGTYESFDDYFARRMNALRHRSGGGFWD